MIPRKKFFIAPAAHAALWDSIQGSKYLTTVVGLGEKTGTQFARMIARSGHEAGTFVRMVATMPFPFQNDFAMNPVDKAPGGQAQGPAPTVYHYIEIPVH